MSALSARGVYFAFFVSQLLSEVLNQTDRLHLTNVLLKRMNAWRGNILQKPDGGWWWWWWWLVSVTGEERQLQVTSCCLSTGRGNQESY